MAIQDPKPPLRSELIKVFKDPRTLKAFEKIFELIPSQLEINQGELEAAQLSADNAAAQALLAIALINIANELIELKSLEPSHHCACQAFEDLAPRIELTQQDCILPSNQMIEPLNLNLEVI